LWDTESIVNRKLISAFLGLLLLTMLVGCEGCLFYRYHSSACKQRGAQYAAKAEKLKRDAHESLKIGTKKEDVIRFFKENGLPVDFVKLPEPSGKVYEATGTIHVTGCAPSGCGSDDASLGLQVKVDEAGSVIAEPVVGGIYTDCL
jgi:hypothetical protein